ncbi:MAG: hypothetical protein BGO29_05790 [Bacteroidales bacterium 36-12]|nr:MAG: hypothetical protein BGO29_05790 [Bacteroidales bacterium 36-12]
MKTKYSLLLLLVASLFVACKPDNEIIPERSNLKLKISTDEVLILNEEQQNDTVLTFEWNEATEIGKEFSFTYLFQIDIADNDFKTAINPITIENGENKIGFTAGELYDYIVEKWNKSAGEIIRIEARVAAKVNGPKFMYPEVATAMATIQTYVPESQSLYILGTATPVGMDASNALKMNEISNGRIYSWSGELQQGSFKFITQPGSMLPSLNKGVEDTILVVRNTEEEPDDYFIINQPGLYYIYLSKKEMTIKTSMLKYQNVYLIGNATSAEWEIDKAIEMTSEPTNPSTFTVQTTLKAGELKMPTAKSWSAPAFRPMVADGSITDTNTQVISAGDGPNDIKWKITAEQAGTYKITLDTEHNKIYFVKI